MTDTDDLLIDAARSILGDTHVDDILASYESRENALWDLRRVLEDSHSSEFQVAVFQRLRWTPERACS